MKEHFAHEICRRKFDLVERALSISVILSKYRTVPIKHFCPKVSIPFSKRKSSFYHLRVRGSLRCGLSSFTQKSQFFGNVHRQGLKASLFFSLQFSIEHFDQSRLRKVSSRTSADTEQKPSSVPVTE